MKTKTGDGSMTETTLLKIALITILIGLPLLYLVTT